MSVPSTQKSGFDTRLESYAPFYDETWNDEFMKLVIGTELASAAFDMARSWRAASDARSLPWLMARCFDAFISSIITTSEPLERVFIREVATRLIRRLQDTGEKVRPMLVHKIEEACADSEAQAQRAMERARDNQRQLIQSTWNINIQQDDVKRSLWSSERTNYCSLYYNYEFFLGECVRIKKRLDRYRVVPGQFKDDFEAAFGTSLLEQCWSDRDVNLARLARHAIVHAGGRETNELRSQKHPFEVQGKEIQIFAPETTTLYGLLKERVILIANTAVAMPEFAGSGS